MRRVAAIATLVVAACRRDPPMVSDDRRALLPPEAAEHYHRVFHRGEAQPKGYFVPTAREIDDLETRLPALLRKEAPRPLPPNAIPLAERAPSYRRQYIATIDSDGRKRIWGNFFCVYEGALPRDRWKTDVVLVHDGGDCYFNVEFSPDDHTFRNLTVNGDA
jgi:hypothetical protein